MKIIPLHSINLVMKSKFATFIYTGILNTIFGYSIFSLFIYLNIKYPFALLFSTITGIAFNYKTFGRFVFKEKKGNLVFIKFIFSYFFLYLLNVTLLNILTLTFNAYTSQIICLFPMAIISWVIFRFFVFKTNS